MSMADRDGFIWHDGRLVPWREATIDRLARRRRVEADILLSVEGHFNERFAMVVVLHVTVCQLHIPG